MGWFQDLFGRKKGDSKTDGSDRPTAIAPPPGTTKPGEGIAAAGGYGIDEAIELMRKYCRQRRK